MSTKAHYSGSDSSPEENKLYISPPSFVREREEKGWKAFVANSELMTTASAIFNQISNPSNEEEMNNQVSFLYDYYGMTDETRQDPPSPGHSPVTSSHSVEREIHEDHRSTEARHVMPTSDNIDVPLHKESLVPDTRHSFPDKPSIPIFGGTTSGESLLSRKLHGSLPAINKIEKTIVSNHIPTTSIESEKTSFSHYVKPMVNYEEKYVYILEAQTSLIQKRGEDTLTYLNKGQFYFVSFEAQPSKLQRVKSVIHLVFRHEKEPENERSHWRYWYNQQPNPNQRALDIDMKACQNIDDVEEVGYNALAVYWDPNTKSKVSLRINCLSTDFSPQKGVKGIPLHLQIDTFEDVDDGTVPSHRSFCQIKVFRDKGAERKNKDESKTVSKRMVKYMKGSENSQTDVSHVFQMAHKVTFLYPTSNIVSKSVIFVPTKEKERERSKSVDSSSNGFPNGFFSQLKERENKRGFNAALSNAKDDLEHLDVLPKQKTARVIIQKPVVTIYVRKEEEKAYNALMLEAMNTESLKKAIAMKYNVPDEMIKQMYKKTKKGILVYVDDQMVEQFADEDDFLISINFDNQLGHFEVIFNC